MYENGDQTIKSYGLSYSIKKLNRNTLQVTKVIDEKGIVTGEVEIHPSWLKAANKLRSNFGDIRELTYQGTQFLLIELDLSFLDGEVAEVQKLQSNQAGKKAWYRILTNSEAKQLLSGQDIFQ